MKERFSNDKAHIKVNKHTCAIVNHYLDINHNLVYTPDSKYNETFSECIKVKLIEKVDLGENDNQEECERKCELREAYWQTQLKTFERYGGLNKRHSQKYEIEKLP